MSETHNNQDHFDSIVDYLEFASGFNNPHIVTPPPFPSSMSVTQCALWDQLCENTGMHMLDSGGASGRMWQRNRKASPAQKQETSISVDHWGDNFDGAYYDVTHNLYHYLSERTQYLPAANRAYNKLFENSEDSYWEDVEMFGELIKVMPTLINFFLGGDHSDGMRDVYTGYTYNEEHCLSQDFQYAQFELGDTLYILISTHNGCDARGGFSKPVVYETWEESCHNVLAGVNGFGVACKKYHRWDYDCGDLNAEHFESEKQINLFTGRQHYDTQDLGQFNFTDDPEAPGVFVDKDDAPHCPLCGPSVPLVAYSM